jgi:predicted membrane-bound mannosyltransferase
VTKSGTHTAGVALVVLAGILVGGAWSLFKREPRTQVVLIASVVLAVVAAALFFSGFTRLG